MSEAWLENHGAALRDWIRRNPHPLWVTKADGSIIYANRALEKLLGYNEAEIPELNWKELTVSTNDLAADVAMVNALMAGERESYDQQKAYWHKTGKKVDCFINVLRWPLNGADVDFFLVTVSPIDQDRHYVTIEIEKIRLAMLAHMEVVEKSLEPRKSNMEILRDWASENKLVAWCVALFMVYLVFGERAIDGIQKIIIMIKGV